MMLFRKTRTGELTDATIAKLTIKEINAIWSKDADRVITLTDRQRKLIKNREDDCELTKAFRNGFTPMIDILPIKPDQNVEIKIKFPLDTVLTSEALVTMWQKQIDEAKTRFAERSGKYQFTMTLNGQSSVSIPCMRKVCEVAQKNGIPFDNISSGHTDEGLIDIKVDLIVNIESFIRDLDEVFREYSVILIRHLPETLRRLPYFVERKNINVGNFVARVSSRYTFSNDKPIYLGDFQFVEASAK